MKITLSDETWLTIIHALKKVDSYNVQEARYILERHFFTNEGLRNA